MVGIYCIEINNKIYIGSSINIERRWTQHFRELKDNKHYNIKLQNAYNKHKIIEFIIIELCIVDNLFVLEQYWIDQLDSVKEGYNIIKKVVQNIVDYKSFEFKQKIARSQLGRKHSEETKAKMREASLGKPKSEEAKKNMSIARTGHIHTEEHKRKISKAGKGRKHTEESKKKISDAKIGKPSHPQTLESREKISKTLTGRKGHSPSDEQRKKISDKLKGQPSYERTEEIKQKASERTKEIWRKRKEEKMSQLIIESLNEEVINMTTCIEDAL